MAIDKPVAFPRWNTGASPNVSDAPGDNREEPDTGKLNTGWIVDEQPPSDFFNWLFHFGGLWDEWLDERNDQGLIGGGGDEEDYYIHPPEAATDGGTMSVAGADGVGSGSDGGDLTLEAGVPVSGDANGGVVTLKGGDAIGTGTGGTVNIDGGTAPTSGDGGDAFLRGGDSTDGTGGAAQLRAGDSTNSFAATAVVAGGSTTTGSGGSAWLLAGASTGAGSGGDVLITAGPSTTGTPGDVTISSGNANTGPASGGTMDINGGNGAGVGDGGTITIKGGDAGTSGIGGNIDVTGGDAAGTDQDGGEITISGGTATGTGHSTVILKAQHSSTSVPTNYIVLAAAGNRRIDLNQYTRLQSGDSSTSQLNLGANPGGSLTSSPLTGDLEREPTTDQLMFYDGTLWKAATPLVFALSADSATYDGTGGPGFQTITESVYTIPANRLQAGSVIKVRSMVELTGIGTMTGFRARLRLVDAGATFHVLSQTRDTQEFVNDLVGMDSMTVVRAIGGTGSIRTASLVYPEDGVIGNKTVPWDEDSTGTVDFNGSLTLDLQIEFEGATDVADKAVLLNHIVEIL